MKFTKPFENLDKNDISIAGGKGASLGEMTQAGFPIPEGFVILVSAFDKFLEETDLGVEILTQLSKINFKDINSVDRASNVIRDLICDAKMPKEIEEEIIKAYQQLNPKSEILNSKQIRNSKSQISNKVLVAVRSSATVEDSSIASWAGELESYLNVSQKDLLEKIKKCWASLFTPRALFYAFEKKIIKTLRLGKIRAMTCKELKECHPVSVAVIVQRMVQSEVSGICFTAHPVTKNRNQMIIEAGWGLGEAIVGGKITPDTYVIEKFEIRSTKSETNSKSQILNSKQFKIIDKNISKQEMMIVKKGKETKEVKVSKEKQEKQKLSDKQILKLAQICQEIEKHYNFPQDIEFAIEKGKIYILQARPITSLEY